jgi:HK97 family phage major capsid protein/HK97 family phage prohead protease
MNRAYSVLHVKSVDAEQRILRGMATTPTPDRMGDIVEPKGVHFKNPMPLLWQHKHDKPVGWVTFDKPTDDGIAFEARLPQPEDAGTSQVLRDRIEEAWQSVKLGLVRAVSIGFKAIELEWLKETDGIRFIESEVLELSLVTIPANAEATISQIKSIDAPLLAATGMAVTRPNPPGVTGPRKTAKAKERKMPKTIAEQISAYEATRAAKAARMDELMQKAADEGVTLDDAESEEYETLEGEVKKIDAHLVRLNALEKQNKLRAKAVEENKDPILVNERATIGHNSGAVRVSNVKSNAPPGTGFTRLAISLAYGKGDTMRAIQRAKSYGDMPELAGILEADIRNMMDGQKAAVPVGLTTDPTWAGPLVTYNVLTSEFIALLRPATIIGRIDNLRRVPFNIQMPATTTGSTVNWVGEAAPKPVSSMAFTTVTLRWAKAAGIIVLTDELVRFSNPSAEAVVRADLIAAMAQFLDRQFVDPAVAAVANVSPASITNGVVPTTATGTTEAAFRADAKAMLSGFLANNLSAASGVWIMTQQQALAFSLMTNPLGQSSFPTINAQGGLLMGYPVVASENLPATGGSPADGYPIIFALASEIMLADDGQTVIDASNQASVQMDSAPDSPPTGTTPLVSLWQMNMTGIRAERWINWQKRRSTAVSFIQNAKYA